MDIIFELSIKESFSRQLEALWNGGFGEEILTRLKPAIEDLAKQHYLDIAASGKGGSRDPRLGIESGAMFQDLTTPIIQDNAIILDTSLDYAMEQEDRLKATSGRSFLPSEDAIYDVIAKILQELS